MSIFNRFQTFATNGTVDAASLHNLIDATTIRQGLITSNANTTSVGTNYELLIADMTNANANPNAVTVYDLFQDALTAGTYTNANISEALTYGTATGTRLVSTNATITTGTITTGVIPTLTAGTTTSTAATITNGTITTALIPTLTAGTTTGTAGIFTSGTIATLNSTTGTIATLVASAGTFAGSLVNVTTGTIGTLNSTTGTIATLNSTTGTITNLSTTLAGDFTISQGTGTIGAAKVKPANLSQPFTSATAVASTSGTAIDFTGIPSWVARIMVTFGGVSVSGTSPFLVQLGTGAGPTFTSSGYTSIGISFGVGGLTSTARTNGFAFADTVSAAYAYGGNAVIAKVSGNIYSFNSTLAAATTTGDGSCVGAGSVSLGAVLTSIRITTVGGANTFDAGSINIMYEG